MRVCAQLGSSNLGFLSKGILPHFRIFSYMSLLLVPVSLLLVVAREALASLSREGQETVVEDFARFDEELWDGLDIEEVALQRMHANEFGSRTVGATSQAGANRNVHVLGLQDTGTNLLYQMLMINLGSHLTFYDSTTLTPHGQYRTGIWKHSNIKELYDYNASALERMSDDKVVAFMMVRDPMSWLQSVSKAPYELSSCTGGQDWLTRPCLHRVPAGYNQAPPKQFSNLEEVWNAWTSAYEHYYKNGLERGLVIRYEDLVLEPERTMDVIAAKLNMDKPDSGWSIAEKSAKYHGDSHGRLEAIKKIESKSFLSSYVGSEVEDSCARLDPKLLDLLTYKSCQGRARVSLEAVPVKTKHLKPGQLRLKKQLKDGA